MKNKLWLLPAGLLVVIFITYYQHHHPENVSPLVSGATYDKSIKAQEGVPIKVTEVIDGDTIVLENADFIFDSSCRVV